MGQSEVLERLYVVKLPLTAEELSVILELSLSSVNNSIRRLKKYRYIVKADRGFILTSRGVDFVERYILE